MIFMALAVFAPRPAFAQGHDGHMRHCALPATSIAEVPMGSADAHKSPDCPMYTGKYCDMHDKAARATCDMSRCGYTDGSSLPSSLNDGASGGWESAIQVEGCSLLLDLKYQFSAFLTVQIFGNHLEPALRPPSA